MNYMWNVTDYENGIDTKNEDVWLKEILYVPL